MKHNLPIAAVFLAFAACTMLSNPAPSLPGVAILSAQSLPAVIHVTWENAADGDGHDSWLVSLDGTPLPSVPRDATSLDVTVMAAGAHTLAIAGQLRALSGNPDEVGGSQTLSSVPQIVKFQLNLKADAAKSGKVSN